MMEGDSAHVEQDEGAAVMMSCLVTDPDSPELPADRFQLNALKASNVPRGQEEKGSTCESTLELC